MEGVTDVTTDAMGPEHSAGAPGDTAARRGRVRRRRTLTQSLGAIVLGFQSMIVVLCGLVIFGLRVLPDEIPDWWAIVAGVVVAGAMMLTTMVLQYRWGVWLGWFLQALVAASALLVPGIWLVVAIFGGMWAYAMIMGPRLEARGAQMAAGNDSTPTN